MTNEDWHLDKRITLAVIILLVINFGSTLWQASKLVQNIKQNSTAIEKQAQRIASIESSQSINNERLARIEERSNFQIQLTTDIKQSLKEMRKELRQ